MKSSKTRLDNQPKYQIGQAVKVNVKTEHKETGKVFGNTIIGLISIIKASGTSKKNTYQYGITTDMPGCYHSGNQPFTYVQQDNIVLA